MLKSINSRASVLILLLSPINLLAIAPNTVVATITAGVNPSGIAITPDNRFAYVTNNNNYGIAGQDTVTVLDLTTNTVVTTIHDASFQEPYRVSINPAGTKAYISNSNGTTITIIDIATNKVIGIITGFDGPSGMAITPNGLFGYVNNYGGPGGVGSGNGTTVNVVDLTTHTIIGPALTVGLAPAAVAMSPDGAFVYVINYTDGNPGTGTLSIIRTSDNSVILNAVTGFSGPFGIALTPNGKYAYITNFGSNNFAPFGTTASVVDVNNRTIVATINLGIQPAGIAVTPDGHFVYASNYNTLYAGPGFTNLTPGQGTVNIINITTNTVIPPIIAVGESPSNIAIAPNGEFAYVVNYTSNIITVIALQSFQITAQVNKIENIFLTQKEFVNKITLQVTGSSLPVSYAIYRDAQLTDLAGTIKNGQPLEFLDHQSRLNSKTYYIVGTNRVGTTSQPVIVTVN
jgi:YVTN family beta-propeller protein